MNNYPLGEQMSTCEINYINFINRMSGKKAHPNYKDGIQYIK